MEGKQLVGAAEGAKSGENEICFHCCSVIEDLLCCWCPANLDSPLLWGTALPGPPMEGDEPSVAGGSSSTSLAVRVMLLSHSMAQTCSFPTISPWQVWGSHLEWGVKALESPSLPTLRVRGRLGKGYFYLWGEEPFSPLSSCQAVFVGGSRQCFKNIHFQQTSSWGLVNFIWPAQSHLPAPSAAQ